MESRLSEGPCWNNIVSVHWKKGSEMMPSTTVLFGFSIS